MGCLNSTGREQSCSEVPLPEGAVLLFTLPAVLCSPYIMKMPPLIIIYKVFKYPFLPKQPFLM